MSKGPLFLTRPLRLAAACLLVAAATGCSAGTDGPLSFSGGSGRLCVPVPVAGDALVGKTVANSGNRTLTLSEVSLNGAESMRLKESYATEMEPTDVAISTGTTEAVRAGDGPIWRNKSNPDSLSLEPGDRANIVISLSVDSGAPEGTAEAIEIHYTSEGKSYRAESTTKILLPRSPC